MSDDERMLCQVGYLLATVARPHACDAELPKEVQASLWDLGFACTEGTSREDLIARLWARKRSLLLEVTPPSAA